MNSKQLRLGREQKGWTQKQAAQKLGVSQPYLSLLERGQRYMPEELARKAVHAYGASATALPLNSELGNLRAADETSLARDLGALGYPGFAYLSANRSKNPAETLLTALASSDLSSRVTEALPWVLLKYPDLDWEWLQQKVRANLLQNKLGFLTTLARRVAERKRDLNTAALLREKEQSLEQSLLVKEDALGRESLKKSERSWLAANRPEDAKRWRVLTDLRLEHLSYG